MECGIVCSGDMGTDESKKEISGGFWRDKMTNEEVLKRVGETRSMLGIIHRQKCRRIGHIL